MKKIMKASDYRVVDNITVIIKLEWHCKSIRVGQQASHADERKDDNFIA